MMIRIAITPDGICDNEAKLIKLILRNGWDYVHLRHPAASWRDMRNLIETIPQSLHKRIRLHGHFELTNHFNLGGLHLNRRCPLAPENYTGKLSKTCHSLEELKECKNEYEYLTLSPIFDKYDDNTTFSKEDLIEINKMDGLSVIALGGVTPEHIAEICRMGFRGYAVRSALSWTGISDMQESLNKFDVKPIH